MSLMWIKKQAPWVIGTFGILILAGLIMMDRAGSYKSDRHHNIVGSVDGEEIPTERFQQDVKNYLRGEEARNGKAPEGLQLVQIREGLFNFKVQFLIMEKIFKQYQLYASKEEMLDYVTLHPQEVASHIMRYKGYEELPQFMADSNINQSRYENWLAQDSVYDRMSMRELEDQLKTSVIPQLQLQQIMKSQIHRTALEEAFTIGMRENKAKLKYYHVSVDSFPVSADKFKDPELKAYFEANPDSFYFHDDAARLAFVRIPLVPSKADTAIIRDFAKELKDRTTSGEKFSDLAADYSNDPSSAKGGKLEGYRTRKALDPSIADAAFNLKVGEVSDPILTRAGYQLIQLNDKQGSDTAAKVQISGILLHIAPGSETTDSLMEIAEKIRTEGQKDGLEKAAKDFSLPFEKTSIFEKTNLTPLGGAYIQGANSFAFSQFEAKEKVSEALQAEDGIYLFQRDGDFSKGRNFERSKQHIAEILVKQEKIELAKKELESHKGEITGAPETAMPAKIGKAVLDSTASGMISADNWLPGFGYSSPTLFKVFTQSLGAWGPVLTSDLGSVISKVSDKSFLSEKELQDKAAIQMTQSEPYQLQTLYQEWVANLPKSAKVENKMDMVYRN